MSDDDDDNIEFDFFEEPAAEPPPRRGITRPRPRRPEETSARPTVHMAPGIMPVLRLTGLVAAAIVVVVVLIWGLKGCSSSTGAYKSYENNMGAVASDSQDLGTQLSKILATPSLNESSLEKQLNGLVQRADTVLQNGRGVRPPGKLLQEHQNALLALQLRRTALQSLLQTFKVTAKQKANAGIGTLLVAQVQNRLLASDVVWRDGFQTASKGLLPEGVKPPASVILLKPANLDSTSLANLWKRVRTTSASANVLRGTALGQVKVLPQGDVLSQTNATVIKASTNLQFQVSVTDTGERQEAHIVVTVTILQATAIKLTGTIDVINPGETKTVTLPYTGQPSFGIPLKIKVDVAPVPGEARLSNNTAEFPVEFQV